MAQIIEVLPNVTDTAPPCECVTEPCDCNKQVIEVVPMPSPKPINRWKRKPPEYVEKPGPGPVQIDVDVKKKKDEVEEAIIKEKKTETAGDLMPPFSYSQFLMDNWLLLLILGGVAYFIFKGDGKRGGE